ncbi:MAG: hypothetical protein QG567_1667 [Campylobacterota bacterium]|nr:hypothetical protein [Campylobacterota bacterium]
MELIQFILNVVAGVGLTFLFMLKKNYFPKYLEEKAKNLATKEDIELITSKVESVKLEHNTKFDEIQKRNDLFFSELKNTKERFNSKQFELYNQLWSSLIDLKISADELWDFATIPKLKDFSKKVINAKIAIEKNSLLIENKHYRQLIGLINKFEDFRFGKENLLSLKSIRNKTQEELNYSDLYQQDLNDIISENRQTKNNYDSLLDKLKIEFVKQIKGRYAK